MKNYYGVFNGKRNNFPETAMLLLGERLIKTLKNTPERLLSFLFNLLSCLRRWMYKTVMVRIPQKQGGRSYMGYRYGREEGKAEYTVPYNIFNAAEIYVSYIAAQCSDSQCNRQLRASADQGGRHVSLKIDSSEEITDNYKHIRITWKLIRSKVHKSKSESITKKSFMLTIDVWRQRSAGLDFVKEYLRHVISTSEGLVSQDRQRQLFTNGSKVMWSSGPGKGCMWDRVNFNHPASFDTFAMDPADKKMIMDDLDSFSQNQAYYAKTGRAWKRGYLIYGPPGTGKSTMIACIANYLKYDVYDVELTGVASNSHLRQLVVSLPSKAIMVIEDIDCSLDLTGARKPVIHEEAKKDGKSLGRGSNASTVTLSGLLNCVDGLWSACGGERLVIFTTNHIDRLDPALIRKGRMDMWIKLSNCKFEAFKVLAKNYLGIDEHPLFERIAVLLEELEIAPADVAEQLLPKNIAAAAAAEQAENCLEDLISKLVKMKEEQKSNAVDIVQV